MCLTTTTDVQVLLVVNECKRLPLCTLHKCCVHVRVYVHIAVRTQLQVCIQMCRCNSHMTPKSIEEMMLHII